MNGEMRYQPARVFTHDELVCELESGDPQRMADALISAVSYDDDTKWIQDTCLRLLSAPELAVRWSAATCLGDMAFIKRGEAPLGLSWKGLKLAPETLKRTSGVRAGGCSYTAACSTPSRRPAPIALGDLICLLCPPRQPASLARLYSFLPPPPAGSAGQA